MAIADIGEPVLDKDSAQSEILILYKLNRWQWWLLVRLNVVFLIAGQTAAVILGRFYYDQGGSSTFMSTFVQTAGFPTLFVPLLLLPPSLGSPTPSDMGCCLCVLYQFLEVYPIDSYCCGCSFNFCYSTWVHGDSDAPEGVTKSHYVVGFLCTLRASAIYSLLLSLMQLTFEKVASVGVVGLIFLVSSLFSTVISTVALAVAAIASLIVFHDKMNDVKIIAMLMAHFGFASCIYQNCIDDSGTTQSRRQIEATYNRVAIRK
ncbi:putative purine permease 11 [Silene latifolia]|uniref:putative purine permease 11 n=1 Tax=Silene latifolia TaxID=37657 RepID=UPI003D76BC2C